MGAAVVGGGVWLRWAPRFVQDEEVEVAAACAVAVTVCGILSWQARPSEGWERWGLLPGAWLLGVGIFLAANGATPSPRFELLGPVLELVGGVCLLSGLQALACRRGSYPKIRARPGPKAGVRGVDGRARKAQELVPGERIRLKLDEPVPVDVVLTEGKGFVDAVEVDGRGAPMSVGPGTELMAGTVPRTEGLQAEVQADHADSFQTRRTEALKALLPKLLQGTPEDRVMSVMLGLLALTVGVGVGLFSIGPWDKTCLQIGAAWLLVMPGLAFLAVHRARQAALRCFAKLGVMAGDAETLLGLMRARRWLVDPLLLGSEGDLEVLALGSLAPSEGARWAAALFEGVDGLERPALRRWLEKAELDAPTAVELEEVDGVRKGRVEGHQVLAGRLQALAPLGLELTSTHGKALRFLEARRMLIVGLATEGRGLQFLLGIKPVPTDEVVRACQILDASMVPVLDHAAMDALSAATELSSAKRETRPSDATLLRATGPRPAKGYRIRALEGRLEDVPPGRAPTVGRRVLPDWSVHVLGARRQLSVQRWVGIGTVVAGACIGLSLAYAQILTPGLALMVALIALSFCGSELELVPRRKSVEG
ncbi:MAG: hypothetical protein AAGD10_15780 [Myxococcota bacterium]